MNKSLYFKDEAWMKYHKCPLCDRYVLKEPELIKVPRASGVTRKVIRWNAVLLSIIFDKKTTPCIKCVSDVTRYLIIYYNRINHPITATRTGLVVGGDIYEKT